MSKCITFNLIEISFTVLEIESIVEPFFQYICFNIYRFSKW